jgi:hypothetical protein
VSGAKGVAIVRKRVICSAVVRRVAMTVFGRNGLNMLSRKDNCSADANAVGVGTGVAPYPVKVSLQHVISSSSSFTAKVKVHKPRRKRGFFFVVWTSFGPSAVRFDYLSSTDAVVFARAALSAAVSSR